MESLVPGEPPIRLLFQGTKRAARAEVTANGTGAVMSTRAIIHLLVMIAAVRSGGALVRDDPNCQLVPASRLSRGVDY